MKDCSKTGKRTKQNKRNLLSIIGGAAIGLLFLGIWLQLIDTGKVSESLRSLNVLFVVTGTCFYLTAYFLRALRWRMLLKTVVPIGVLRAFLTVMGGHFTNYLIPLRAGELMKCLFIKKMTGVRMSQSMPSVFLDKLYDTTGIVLVFLLLPFLRINIHPYLHTLLIVIVVLVLTALFLLAAVLYNKEKVISFVRTVSSVFPIAWREKSDEIVRYFIEGIALFREHKGLIFPAVMLSLLILLCDSLFFLSMFWAFGKEIGYFYILFGYTLIYLSFIVPHPPAQIGSNELLMVLIFSVGMGMNKDVVSAIMVFAHLLTGTIMIGVGILSYSYAGVSLLNFMNKGEEFDD